MDPIDLQAPGVPVLGAKLHPPRVSGDLVARDRLLELLAMVAGGGSSAASSREKVFGHASRQQDRTAATK